MTIAQYLLIIKQRWRVWGTVLAGGLLTAALMTVYSPTEYTAKATSFVTVTDLSRSGQPENFQNSQFAVQRVKSYASLIDSPRVLGPVIHHLELTIDQRQLARKVAVSSPADTVLLIVTATDEDPVLAKRTANALSQSLGEAIEDLEGKGRQSNSMVEVSLTEPASVPQEPSSPRTLLNLALGAIAGLTLGAAASVVRDHFDRRIRSTSDLLHATGAPPLGSAVADSLRGKGARPAADWSSVAAENYRTIRTALQFGSSGSRIQHFVVTSPTASEGKSSLACDLAISWAQGGASVCLVEADLRRPSVATHMGLDAELGMSDVVMGRATLADVLVSSGHEGVTTLPAGSLPPDPVALLGCETTRQLASALIARFDIVVYDAPPILSVADAAVLGRQTDGILLAVIQNATQGEEVSASVDATRRAQARFLGSVLMRDRARAKDAKHRYATDSSLARPELPPLSPEPREMAM